ncbi:T9SS type A sorting domain-containing protein [bacterium]|nr:T9SS type A sorting domain-containing protein [bacterium]
MKKFTMFAALALAMVFALSAFAGEMPYVTKGNSTLHGGSANFAKAAGDTIDVMGPTGSGAAYIGDFESGGALNGGASGWTTEDVTQPTVTHFQLSNYNQTVASNLAAWCGDISFPSCDDSLDPAGGYGNSWHDLISCRITVADPGSSASVNVTATLQHDTEPGYDYTRLSAKIQGNLGYTDIQSWDGAGTVAVNNGLTYLPAELVGGTDVYMVFRVQSDGGWSDADCSWPTAGACQVDDITVTVTQAGQTDIVSFTDFQDVGGVLDVEGLSTFDWFIDFPDGVGDFAKIWDNLEDADPCNTNYSNQVAFIDDGLVVPGTGGTTCINWCYGPAGYIVNTTGGLAGPASHIYVWLNSPVMTWPNASYDGMLYSFDAYRHEDLSVDAPGIFYTWSVRSADTDDSAGNGAQVLSEQPWLDRNFVYFGGPDYLRVTNDVTDLMNAGRDVIQVQTGCYELGWAFGYTGNDGYPAPYFDNFAVKVFPYVGPGVSTREIDLANDNFPENEVSFDINQEVNPATFGGLHVRFDMARNISLAAHLRNDPGDSMVIDIVPVRSGATLAGTPEFHYSINANPEFNAYRTFPTSGMIPALGPAVGASGIADPDAWAFDIPDTGALFPGDVLHWYVRAGDQVGADIQYATFPADISGFGDFSGPLSYNSTMTIHALPTISDDGGAKKAPQTLFWNDFANRGGEAEWYAALGQLGMGLGSDYDIYYTNGPSSSVGNGIGGRTSGLSLEGYNNMLYTAGDLGTTTLSNGDYAADAGNDIGAVLAWLGTGNKNLVMTGDDLVSDLAINAGAAGLAFSEDVMGVNAFAQDARSFINNQTTPLVVTIAGNSVFSNISSWIAYGGCFGINTFDAVTTRAGAERLAEFTDPNGGAGAYSFSAATLNVYNTTNNVISFPYDFMFIYDNPDESPANTTGLSARARVLSDIFDAIGIVPGSTPTPVPGAEKFAVSNYPNPFNPATKISYTMPKAGHMTLKVYNVRGQLVKTLIDGQVAAGTDFVMWDGTNNQGSNVASGVYFYEARSGNNVQVNKMALVK